MSKKSKRQGRDAIVAAAATSATNQLVALAEERIRAASPPPPAPPPAPPAPPPPPSAIETVRALGPVDAALWALDPDNAAAIAREHATRGGR